MIDKNMTNEAYHEHPAIGSSDLKNILSSPALYKYRAENEIEKTDAMSLGTALHTWFLEPEIFAKEYVIGEKKSKGENAHFLESVNGDVNPAYYKKFLCMQKALNESKEVQEILSKKAMVEASFFVEEYGESMKCRPDLLTKDGWLVDLKTVSGMDESPSLPENFNRHFFDRKYDLQMFMYKKIVEKEIGKKFKGFKFIVVDSKEPISGVNIYTFVEGESRWFEIGGHRFHEALEIYKECKKTNDYYVYKDVNHDDLPLSYDAAEYYASICEGGKNDI